MGEWVRKSGLGWGFIFRIGEELVEGVMGLGFLVIVVISFRVGFFRKGFFFGSFGGRGSRVGCFRFCRWIFFLEFGRWVSLLNFGERTE